MILQVIQGGRLGLRPGKLPDEREAAFRVQLTRKERMPASAPLRPIAYAAPRIVCERGADGALRCRSLNQAE